MKQKSFWDNQDIEDVAKKPKASRKLPIDAIMTFPNAPICCLAVDAGFLYGIQSNKQHAKGNVCRYEDNPKHKLEFIDNNYFNYNHGIHRDCVKRFNPKYATVMDILTPKQAIESGVKHHYEFEKIMDFAYELNEYAENVIVIPKYDCLHKIPNDFILGYSVPTSHGGTTLPIEMFKGRKIHLLGGSWKTQLELILRMGDDIVSFDNNYIGVVSKNGAFVSPDGDIVRFSKAFNPVHIRTNNTIHLSLSISFENIASKIHEIVTVRNLDK